MNLKRTLYGTFVATAFLCSLAGAANAQQAASGDSDAGRGMMQGTGHMGPGMMMGSGTGPHMMQGYGSSGDSDAASSAAGDRAAMPDLQPGDAPVPDRVVISVVPHALPGPDGKRHDAFLPSNLVLKAGVEATLVLVNYDDMAHSLTAPNLGLNVMIPAAREGAGGVVTPSVTTYVFTPGKKGTFRWFCAIPCDGAAGGWAMTPGFDGPGRDGYMAGYFAII